MKCNQAKLQMSSLLYAATSPCLQRCQVYGEKDKEIPLKSLRKVYVENKTFSKNRSTFEI